MNCLLKNSTRSTLKTYNLPLWLNNDASFTKTNKIYDFLTENASSSVAIEEAKLLIDIEIAQERGWDFSENGTYIGRSTLKYKAK